MKKQARETSCWTEKLVQREEKKGHKGRYDQNIMYEYIKSFKLITEGREQKKEIVFKLYVDLTMHFLPRDFNISCAKRTGGMHALWLS